MEKLSMQLVLKVWLYRIPVHGRLLEHVAAVTADIIGQVVSTQLILVDPSTSCTWCYTLTEQTPNCVHHPAEGQASNHDRA